MSPVLADTNVLFPFSLMDLMLSLSQHRLHTLLWTDRLLDEWERVIVREGHRAPAAATAIANAVRTFFPEDCVPEDSYKELLSKLTGPDPDDLHHIAAAAVGGARTLITWNLADFPARVLEPLGITAIAPDPYLCDLLEQHPCEVADALRQIASDKRKPPMTAVDLTAALARAGVPGFAERARQRLIPS